MGRSSTLVSFPKTDETGEVGRRRTGWDHEKVCRGGPNRTGRTLDIHCLVEKLRLSED